MATQLKNIVSFSGIASGALAALPHGLNIAGEGGVIPDEVKLSNSEFAFVSADATDLTVRNLGALVGDCDALVEHWHTIERTFGDVATTDLTPQPFVGTASPGGVINPLILQTGNGTVTAPAGQASGAIGHGVDGDIGTADVQVDPAGSGLAIGWVDSFAGGTAQVKAGGRASFAMGFANLLGAQTGEISTSPSAYGAMAFGQVVPSDSDAAIKAEEYGAFAFGFAGTSLNPSSYAANIQADGWGSFAGGYAYGYGAPGLVRAAWDGCLAFGSVWGGTIRAGHQAAGGRPGCIAMGYAGSDGLVESRGRGGLAVGCAEALGVLDAGAIAPSKKGTAALGYASGANSVIRAIEHGAFAQGAVLSEGQIEADGKGAFAQGHAITDSDIIADSTASLARGYAEAGGRIYSSGDGSFASGHVDTLGDIQSKESGSFAAGHASDQAELNAWGPGCVSLGYTKNSLSTIYSNFKGAFASGYAITAGRIDAMGNGARAHGYAKGGGEIAAREKGAIAMGYANTDGRLYSSYQGATTLGYAEADADIRASSYGTFATGFVTGATARIGAFGSGAFAGGYANAGIIESTVKGAFAHGYTKTAGVIRASGKGALARGYADDAAGEILATNVGSVASGFAHGGYITASGYGSFAAGFADGTYDILASGAGSLAFGKASTINVEATAVNAVQFGEGQNNVADSMQVGSCFLAKANGQFGGTNKPLTLGVGVTTFATTSNVMTITGDAGANTIATITGGFSGQELVLIFVDVLVTITDDGTHAANTVDLSGAFTGADDTVLKLIFDGTSWYEVSRSVN